MVARNCYYSALTICVLFYLQGDYGDVSARKQLRERLKCKSFDWFIQNIYPDLFIPGDAVASGEVRVMYVSIRVEQL